MAEIKVKFFVFHVNLITIIAVEQMCSAEKDMEDNTEWKHIASCCKSLSCFKVSYFRSNVTGVPQRYNKYLGISVLEAKPKSTMTNSFKFDLFLTITFSGLMSLCIMWSFSSSASPLSISYMKDWISYGAKTALFLRIKVTKSPPLYYSMTKYKEFSDSKTS